MYMYQFLNDHIMYMYQFLNDHIMYMYQFSHDPFRGPSLPWSHGS